MGAFEPGRLAQARAFRGLTPEELADAVGEPTSTIDYYEAGVRSPQPAELARLAKVLGFPVGFFGVGRPLVRVDTSEAHFCLLGFE